MTNRHMKKMLNISNHGGKANQNHDDISPHLSSKSQITNVGKDVEKREPSYTVGGNVNWCSHYGKQYGGSSKN